MAEGVQEEEVAEKEKMPDTINDVIFVFEGTTELRKGKKCVVDVPEQVISKRPRLPLQYVISPFMVEAKRSSSTGCTPIFFISWTISSGKHSKRSGEIFLPW